MCVYARAYTYHYPHRNDPSPIPQKIKVGGNKCSKYSCCELGYGGSESGGWDPVTGLGTINYEVRVVSLYRRRTRFDRHNPFEWVIASHLVLFLGGATTVGPRCSPVSHVFHART